MTASAAADEPPRESLPEALPPAAAVEVTLRFRMIVGWQVSHRMEALLRARWRDGTLKHDHVYENGCLLRMICHELWLPTAVPPEGRNR